MIVGGYDGGIRDAVKTKADTRSAFGFGASFSFELISLLAERAHFLIC
jgi:hypothetical protein